VGDHQNVFTLLYIFNLEIAGLVGTREVHQNRITFAEKRDNGMLQVFFIERVSYRPFKYSFLGKGRRHRHHCEYCQKDFSHEVLVVQFSL
jgi:hypothetical protein